MRERAAGSVEVQHPARLVWSGPPQAVSSFFRFTNEPPKDRSDTRLNAVTDRAEGATPGVSGLLNHFGDLTPMVPQELLAVHEHDGAPYVSFVVSILRLIS